MHQTRHEFLRKDDVVNIDGFLKKWSNFLIPEACYTTSYSGNKERELAVFLGKTDKPNIGS